MWGVGAVGGGVGEGGGNDRFEDLVLDGDGGLGLVVWEAGDGVAGFELGHLDTPTSRLGGSGLWGNVQWLYGLSRGMCGFCS
jgi:hypothetical protein